MLPGNLIAQKASIHPVPPRATACHNCDSSVKLDVACLLLANFVMAYTVLTILHLGVNGWQISMIRSACTEVDTWLFAGPGAVRMGDGVFVVDQDINGHDRRDGRKNFDGSWQVAVGYSASIQTVSAYLVGGGSPMNADPLTNSPLNIALGWLITHVVLLAAIFVNGADPLSTVLIKISGIILFSTVAALHFFEFGAIVVQKGGLFARTILQEWAVTHSKFREIRENKPANPRSSGAKVRPQNCGYREDQSQRAVDLSEKD